MPEEGGGGIGGALSRRLGPLAVWQWGLVLGGGFLLYHYLKTGSLFGGIGSGGGGTASPNLSAGDTGLVPGSALPPPSDIVPPFNPPTSGGSGGQAQADPGQIISGVSPTPVSSGNYGTGTSTAPTTLAGASRAISSVAAPISHANISSFSAGQYGYTPASLAAQNAAEAARHQASGPTIVTAATAGYTKTSLAAQNAAEAARHHPIAKAAAPVTAAQSAASARANTAEKGRAASRAAAQKAKSKTPVKPIVAPVARARSVAV